jgi:hypothetical protein
MDKSIFRKTTADIPSYDANGGFIDEDAALDGGELTTDRFI